MQNFQDTFKARKRSFISAFSICMTVPLIIPYISYRGVFRTLSMLKCFAKSAYRKKKLYSPEKASSQTFGRILNTPLSYFTNDIIKPVVQRCSVKKLLLEISQNS